MAAVINRGPTLPKTVEMAFCTYIAPDTSSVCGTPLDRHINAVAVQSRSVSI